MIDKEDYICFPGRIVKYYEEDQTADILLCAERVFSNAENDLSSARRGVIPRMPVHTPSGGGWSMTMPFKVGDTCILFFSQIGYDHWFVNDADIGGTLVGNPVPHLLRSFDVNDGYALAGLNTLPRAISGYHAENSEWRGPDSSLQVIRLKPDHHIEIESSVQVTVIAPHVQVDCTTSEVNASASADITTATATVTAPNINLAASATVLATTPLFSITGNLLVGGGIGGGGAPAPAGGGLEVTGASKITGALVTTSTVTASDVISGGKSVNGHTHTNPEGGNTGPF